MIAGPEGHRGFLVADPGLRQVGIVKQIETILDTAGIIYTDMTT